jgi:1,4-dihydroxy-2-naphthoate octaprenyltransferase
MEFARAIALGVLVQAASNVNNSFWDFYSGLDMSSAERDEDPNVALKHKSILSDGRVSLTQMMILNLSLLISSVALMLNRLMVDQTMAITYIAGTSLAIFYTAPPFQLKYYALGDIAIFIAFGPLLTYCTILLLDRDNTSQLWSVLGQTLCCLCSTGTRSMTWGWLRGAGRKSSRSPSLAP